MNHYPAVTRLLTLILQMIFFVGYVQSAEPIAIGNRLELFVDNYLIESMKGDVRHQVMKPEPREVVFETGQPWEGNTSGYYTFFQDDKIYRMIYRGWQHDEQKKASHREVTCYAESRDGIKWVKPNLGLFAWNGSKNNNIIWLGLGTHNFTAFRDSNPSVSVEQQYKALGSGQGGLLPFQSSNSKQWKLLQEKPVITRGAFDSQNLAFWDSDRKEYRAYWRIFTKGITTAKNWKPAGYRAIRTATSKDFITWENEVDLTYTKNTPHEHLYTNAIQKYFRAPHMFIGFPTRYEPKSQQVEPIFMASRNGYQFHRFAEAVIPRTAPKDRNHNRSNYMAWGLFQLPGQPEEISVYGTENYYESTPGRVRRFVYRVDGFVALRSETTGGQVVTHPLTYRGERLLMNYQVRRGGSIQVDVIDQSGKLIGRSKLIGGDDIDRAVDWQTKPALGSGVVQLRFQMKNADLFSFRFDG